SLLNERSFCAWPGWPVKPVAGSRCRAAMARFAGRSSSNRHRTVAICSQTRARLRAVVQRNHRHVARTGRQRATGAPSNEPGNEMKRHAIALALAGFLLSPAARADVDLMGKALQVYGKLHVSYDLYDRGPSTADAPDPSDSELVSNSSRLGFKGEVDIGETTKALWKFESEIDVAGEVGELKARSRYVGIGGHWGQVLLGIE